MNKIKSSYFPVFEWTPPKMAIMGGFTTDPEKLKCQDQYLSYLETLSQHINVLYFSDYKNEKIIRSEIDCSCIEFIDYQLDSIWIRDFAPIWLQCSQNLEFALANFPYGANHFGKSEQDDHFSQKLSEYLNRPLILDFPRKHIPFYFDGGNIFVDEDLNCFTSVREDDPPIEFRKELLAHINCKKIISMNGIPGEGTGHVDMFMKILPDKIALLAKYKNPIFNKEMSKNKEILKKLNYEVVEISHSDNEENTSWSYLNSLIIGNKVFVPQYGLEQDLEALKGYQQCGFSVIPIEARDIMREKGSLHCITNFIY